MKTAAFSTYTGPGRVSIARFAPQRTPAGYRQFKAFAPGSWFNSVEVDRYVELFATEILKPLVPADVWKALHELVPAGVEPVLLCWETVEKRQEDPTVFCHRALCAAWLEEHLGERVPELGYEGAERHPLLPTNRAREARP